jgi:DNA-binding NtrC family response regulator
VIAIIAADSDVRKGPIPLALAHAGFETQEIATTDDAARAVGAHGAKNCVLVVAADSLEQRAGSSTWSAFLESHPKVAATVVASGRLDRAARAVTSGRRRVLVESPFDAAAVVSAARRAVAVRRRASEAERRRASEAERRRASEAERRRNLG